MKLSKIVVVLTAILLTSWLFYSCSKDDTLEHISHEEIQIDQDNKFSAQPRSAEESSDSENNIVLGDKRINPFAIAHINQAKEEIYGSSMADKIPTHSYIKFLPASQADLAVLLEWELSKNIPLFDFPLEYEIVTEGETYIDPEVSDSLLTYQYAAVPVEIEIPQIPFEKIDDLFLDKSDPFLLAQSFWQTGNVEDITEYVFQGGLNINEVENYSNSNSNTNTDNSIFSGIEFPTGTCGPGYHWELTLDEINGTLEHIWVCVPDDSPPYTPPLNDCDCVIPFDTRKPAGCVQVENVGVMVGVQIARVKVKDTWFTSDVTFTDVNGCWSVNKNYSGKMWMSIKFKNDNVKVKDQKYLLGVFAVRDRIGRFNNPPFNNIHVEYESNLTDNTSVGRMYWAAAHTLNTVNDYRIRAAADGVPMPRTGLNWLNKSGEGPASAAMLQGNIYNSTPAFLAVFIFPFNYLFTVPFLPDITHQYGEGDRAPVFNGVGYHELGHASHYSIVGEFYWIKYRDHIIRNSGYGTFGNFNLFSHPGHVALGEAIGNFTGALYGDTGDGGEFNEWSDNFIPQGLMHDLRDDTPDVIDEVIDPNTGETVQDNVIGFTTNMIFNGLATDVNSISEFRDRLRELHLSDTPNNVTDYNALLDVYDVFN